MSATITRVQSRGQVTLPKELRERTHISPGDLVRISVTDEGNLQIAPAEFKSLEYYREKFAIRGPFDHDAIRKEAEDIAAREAMGE